MRFEAQSAAGLEYLISRPDGGAPSSLLMGLHGRGSSPEDLEPLAEGLGQDFIHVLPRGPWPYLSGAAWYLDGPERGEQLRRSREMLVALGAALRRAMKLGPERMAVWGFSQGGLLSLEVGLAPGSPLAGVVSIGGGLDDASRTDPQVMGRARGRDFLLVHGVHDSVVPSQRSREAYLSLGAHGGRIELAELKMGHEVSSIAAAAVRGFLRSVLGASPPHARA